MKSHGYVFGFAMLRFPSVITEAEVLAGKSIDETIKINGVGEVYWDVVSKARADNKGLSGPIQSHD